MIIKNVNHIKLLSEFDVANITYDKQNISHNMQYDSFGKPLQDTCDLDIKFAINTNMQLVQAIIDTHDPTPIESMPTELDILKEQIASQQAIIDELLFYVIPSILSENKEGI